MHQPGRDRLEAAAPLLLAGLVVAVFGRCLWADLVWDDKNLITGNPWLASSDTFFATWRQDFWALTTGGGESGMYRPIVIDAYWLEYRLWGVASAGYHAMNLVFHTANSWLVFVLARRLKIQTAAALVGALCFAVHPVQVEAAASVASHTDLLATLGTLAACVLWVGPPRRRWLVSLPLFFALCSKESAVIAPLLLLALDRRLERPLVRKELIWTMLPWIPWIALRANAVGGPGVAAASAWVGASRIFAYLARVLMPLPQGPITELSEPSVVWAGATTLLLAAFTLFVLIRISNRRISFVVIWVLVALAPVAELVPLGSRFADLLLYLPMCGISLGLAEVVASAMARLQTPGQNFRVAGAGLCGLLLTWALISFSWSAVWQSDLSLWTHGVEQAPENVTANLNLGNAYRAAGRVEEGCAQLRQTLEWLDLKGEPGTAGRVHYNLGNCAREGSNLETAEAHYRQSIALTQGGFLPARYNLIVTQAAMGRPDLGLGESEKLVALAPQLAQPWHLQGVMLAQLGRFAEAVAAFDHALTADPSREDTRSYRERAAELASTRESGRPIE